MFIATFSIMPLPDLCRGKPVVQLWRTGETQAMGMFLEPKYLKNVKARRESKRSYLSYKTLYNIFRDENAINVDNCRVLYLQNIPE